MKCNKKFLALAAAGVLTAATAVPALAMEHEVSGAFTSFYDLSNYSAAGNNPYDAADNGRGIRDDAPTENYFVQRVRLGYTAKANDNVKLVTKFELDYNWWGNSAYTAGRGSGGAIGSDSVQIETKHLYLDLNYPMLQTKIGMMGNTDSFKGIIFDADMAGIQFSHNYTSAGVTAGFFRFNDNWDWTNDRTIGKVTVDMMQLDGKFSINKDTKVGAAYYYIEDDFRDAQVHTVGLNAEGVLGPVRLNGFALAQLGDLADRDAEGYALNLGAKMALLGGTLRSEFMFVGGGKHELYNASNSLGVARGTEAGGYYDTELIILGRDKNATTIDNAIIYDVSNYGQGVIIGSLGYDYAFSDKLSGSANAGFAAVANDDNRTVAGSTSKYLGTELNAEANYQLTANVTLGARGGYVFLGDYFDGIDGADNPYDLKIIARYAF